MSELEDSKADPFTTRTCKGCGRFKTSRFRTVGRAVLCLECQHGVKPGAAKTEAVKLPATAAPKRPIHAVGRDRMPHPSADAPPPRQPERCPSCYSAGAHRPQCPRAPKAQPSARQEQPARQPPAAQAALPKIDVQALELRLDAQRLEIVELRRQIVVRQNELDARIVAVDLLSAAALEEARMTMEAMGSLPVVLRNRKDGSYARVLAAINRMGDGWWTVYEVGAHIPDMERSRLSEVLSYYSRRVGKLESRKRDPSEPSPKASRSVYEYRVVMR